MKTGVKLICLAALTILAAPASGRATSTLYERLGGLENIRSFVSQTIERTAADPDTSLLFEGIRLAPVKESVAAHLCEMTGGPCRYEGASMAKVHSGMQISGKQFDLMDAYLGQALTVHGVKDADKAALGALLQPLRADVIAK